MGLSMSSRLDDRLVAPPWLASSSLALREFFRLMSSPLPPRRGNRLLGDGKAPAGEGRLPGRCSSPLATLLVLPPAPDSLTALAGDCDWSSPSAGHSKFQGWNKGRNWNFPNFFAKLLRTTLFSGERWNFTVQHAFTSQSEGDFFVCSGKGIFTFSSPGTTKRKFGGSL